MNFRRLQSRRPKELLHIVRDARSLAWRWRCRW